MTQSRLWFPASILAPCLIGTKFSQGFDRKFWLRSLHVYTALLFNSIYDDNLLVDGYEGPFVRLPGRKIRSYP